jgi:glycosyltransferase involved in cell wall biosynthesis
MANKPLVSVLMTSFNRKQYIGEAIESVLSSTYTNFELIIVDDCSKDSTVDIARRYEKKDNRIKVYVNKDNLGDYPNRNKATSYATGDYIMFVDSDDRIHNTGLEVCINGMLSYPSATFGMYTSLNIKDCLYLSAKESIEKHFLNSPFLTIGPGGTIINRAFFESIHGYPEKYGPANDMYFNLKAAKEAGVLLLPYSFFLYRIHEGQEINNNYSYLYNNYCYLRDALTELNLPLEKGTIKRLEKKNKRRFIINLFKYFLKTKSIRKVKKALRLADFSFADTIEGIFHK